MNLKNFNFRSLKQRDISIVIMVLTLALAGLWYMYMFRPTQTRISELQDRKANLETQIKKGEQAKANLPQIREELVRLDSEFRAFLSELPNKDDVAQLIKTLRKEANTNGITLESLSQSKSNLTEIEGIRPINFSLSTNGKYSTTMSFLNNLENLERYTKVKQVGLSVDRKNSDDPQITASYEFVVYVYTGDTPEAV
ncbi:MAG TPA: hypothetical protein ENK21_05025, partial [Trueperaceae bacterium]|nr:hypothetical protein [Trueperaceae bacterium]